MHIGENQTISQLHQVLLSFSDLTETCVGGSGSYGLYFSSVFTSSFRLAVTLFTSFVFKWSIKSSHQANPRRVREENVVGDRSLCAFDFLGVD
jgi:hypothetical protein